MGFSKDHTVSIGWAELCAEGGLWTSKSEVHPVVVSAGNSELVRQNIEKEAEGKNEGSESEKASRALWQGCWECGQWRPRPSGMLYEASGNCTPVPKCRQVLYQLLHLIQILILQCWAPHCQKELQSSAWVHHLSKEATQKKSSKVYHRLPVKTESATTDINWWYTWSTSFYTINLVNSVNIVDICKYVY